MHISTVTPDLKKLDLDRNWGIRRAIGPLTGKEQSLSYFCKDQSRVTDLANWLNNQGIKARSSLSLLPFMSSEVKISDEASLRKLHGLTCAAIESNDPQIRDLGIRLHEGSFGSLSNLPALGEMARADRSRQNEIVRELAGRLLKIPPKTDLIEALQARNWSEDLVNAVGQRRKELYCLSSPSDSWRSATTHQLGTGR